jgi:DNA (cytosine-5)-methyltransferase 1
MTAKQKASLFDGIVPIYPDAPSRTFAEYFAGIGLVRMGLERTGWTVRFANDMDPLKLRMYEDQFGEAPYYCTKDVHDIAKSPDCVPDVTLVHSMSLQRRT